MFLCRSTSRFHTVQNEADHLWNIFTTIWEFWTTLSTLLRSPSCIARLPRSSAEGAFWALFCPIRQYCLLADLDHSYSTFYFTFSFPMTFHLLTALSFGFSGHFGHFLMELFSLRIISIVYIWCRGLVQNGY